MYRTNFNCDLASNNLRYSSATVTKARRVVVFAKPPCFRRCRVAPRLFAHLSMQLKQPNNFCSLTIRARCMQNNIDTAFSFQTMYSIHCSSIAAHYSYPAKCPPSHESGTSQYRTGKSSATCWQRTRCIASPADKTSSSPSCCVLHR